MEITMMILQLLVVLMALYVGSRYGSLALGAISGIGLAILVFGFGLKPGIRLRMLFISSSPPSLARVSCRRAVEWIG